MPIELKAVGELEAKAKLDQVIRDVRGAEFLRAMRGAILVLERDAKLFAPVDTGRLKASITSEVRSSGLGSSYSVAGVVGTNVSYAPYMEFGTGTIVGRPPHRPPSSALDVWARRHGIASGFLVARAIARKGGLEPRRFFQRSMEKNQQKVIDMLGDGVTDIVLK